MQLKIDFLCRDCILAAPIVFDLVLFMDFAQRAAMMGIQEWFSFYFKSQKPLPAFAGARYFHTSEQTEKHASVHDG